MGPIGGRVDLYDHCVEGQKVDLLFLALRKKN